MKRSIFLLLCCLFSCFLISEAQASKTVVPVFDDRVWKLDYSKKQQGGFIEEYTLSGETVESWSELVTVQFFPKSVLKGGTPENFEAAHSKSLSQKCPGIQWQSLFQAENERIWEWTISDCKGVQDQSEIARLVSTAKGFYILHYAIKRSPMPEESAKVWIENLNAFKINE